MFLKKITFFRKDSYCRGYTIIHDTQTSLTLAPFLSECPDSNKYRGCALSLSVRNIGKFHVY